MLKRALPLLRVKRCRLPLWFRHFMLKRLNHARAEVACFCRVIPFAASRIYTSFFDACLIYGDFKGCYFSRLLVRRANAC